MKIVVVDTNILFSAMHFVALALEYDAELWTRDALLKAELKRKGFNRFFKEK